MIMKRNYDDIGCTYQFEVPDNAYVVREVRLLTVDIGEIWERESKRSIQTASLSRGSLLSIWRTLPAGYSLLVLPPGL